MTEYIERDSVTAVLGARQKALCPAGLWGREHVYGADRDSYDALQEMSDEIDNIPAADVAPVIHGRWIEGAENFTCGNHNAECSVCGANISWSGCDGDFNYCPNCGAKMDMKE